MQPAPQALGQPPQRLTLNPAKVSNPESLWVSGDNQTGYAIWSKRLESGCFHPGDHQGLISPVELSLILEGIQIKQARRFKRFHLRQNIS